MWLWSCQGRWLGALTLLLSGLAALQSANAQEVVKDEYILTPSRAAARSGAIKNNSRINAKKYLSDGKVVVSTSPRSAARLDSTDGPQSAPFNPLDKGCEELLKIVGSGYDCEPNYIVHASKLPNDSNYSRLWGMNAIKAPNAWDVSTGSAQVVVAVIDTGVDYRHSDLADNMWQNPGEIAGNGIDDDGNGYIDDVHGINAINGTGNPMDDQGHGTHVSGTIGAVGNNGTGVAGVNWNVRIMGLKFLSASGSGSISDAIEAINYMVAMKNRGINVRVSNNSWGGGGFSKALQTAIQSAKDAGIIFAAAAGNEGNDNDARPSYPASYDIGNVVSVAATDSNGNLAWFSNYGANAVDIAAPGVDIYSTLPNNQYASLSGTSMATPHVAGALGLLLGSEPGLSMDAAITRLYDTGSPLPTLTGAIRTGRLLNLEGLLKNQGTPLPAPTPVPASCSYGVADAPFAPDTRADGTAPILENVDELNFQTVSLPFGFPFDGVQYSRVILSPNGVAYFGSAPDSMDYQNGPRAPLNSIAAPHTDFRLNTLQVAVGENYATIVWRGSLWSFKNGEVIARLTINADGTIYSTIETSNSGIEAALQQASTVGLMGRERNNFVTYSYNSKKVHDKMAVLYTPNCGGSSPVKVKDMALQGHDGSSSVQAGRKFSVNARTSKSGTSTSANLVLALDGARCEPISVNLKPGSTRITGILPDKAKYFNRFRANLGNVSASAPIESSASRSRARKISKSERTKICNQIAGRLKSR